MDTSTSQAIRAIKSSMSSIEAHYQRAYAHTLEDADLTYTLSFCRQPLAFNVSPHGPNGVSLDLLVWRKGERLYLPMPLRQPGANAASPNPFAAARELNESDALAIDADSARMAWKCLAAIVTKAEKGDGKEDRIVSVHNINGTFGQLHRRRGDRFVPILSPEFKTYQTYDDTFSPYLHHDLLDHQ